MSKSKYSVIGFDILKYQVDDEYISSFVGTFLECKAYLIKALDKHIETYKLLKEKDLK